MPGDGTSLKEKKDFKQIAAALLEDLRSGAGGRVALTDETPGSVVRTLVEAFSRELAVAYAQLDQVYRLGYLDTAEGQALDNVVALLGVTRRRGGRLEGSVTFQRKGPGAEAIIIPAGTWVSGKKQPLVETIAATAIEPGQAEVTVGVRSVDPADKVVDPGKLDTLPRPIFGVGAVENRVPLIVRENAETDAELRARARAFVGGSNMGTKAAIEQAVRALGLEEVSVAEPPERPGYLEVVVGDEDATAMLADAMRAVERVRPAGIRVEVISAKWVDIAISARIELARDLGEDEKLALRREIEEGLRRYVTGLGVHGNVRDAQIQSLLAGRDAVANARKTVTPSVDGAEDAARRRTNGDVLIGPGERARLRPDPPDLVLEPPSPSVSIDVDVFFTAAPPTDAKLREVLSSYLAGLGEPPRHDGSGNPKAVAVKFEQMKAALPATPASLRLTVIHDRDGRVAELGKDGDEDVIDPREALLLRNLTVRSDKA